MRSCNFASLRLRSSGGLLLLVLLWVLVTTSTVAAQSLRSAPANEPTGSKLAKSPAGVEQGEGGETLHETALGSRPPLPFKTPLVGPLIKHTYEEDVDQRTTAFIPQADALKGMTAIDFPKDEKRWIRVDLSEQLVVAYEKDQPVRAFIISSGLPRTPTVTGTYRIRTKVRSQLMVGENYYLPNVEWVQYFYSDYSFHGTYWHNNFGHPMSHGCLNMTIADAKWLFDWAGPVWDGKTTWYKASDANPGTLVIITQ